MRGPFKLPGRIEAAGFVIVADRDKRIWGAGSTSEDARTKAMAANCPHDFYRFHPASACLLVDVAIKGGNNVAWVIVGNVACTVDEAGV